MGYYTFYSLEARKVTDKEKFDSIVKALQDKGLLPTETGLCSVFNVGEYYKDDSAAYFTAYDECKWYDCEKDMIDISKQFPDVVFQLSGDGEERDDMWREYFKNGKYEKCPAQIIFPTPVEIEWD